MALRNQEGSVIENEDDWLIFFRDKLKFPASRSAEYAKHLTSECFTGDTLAECIEDQDMQSLLKMPLGHYKKLKCFLRPPVSHEPTSVNTGSNNHTAPKLVCPSIKLESTQLQFEQFEYEWKCYKAHYNLSDKDSSTTLFFSCSEEIRQLIKAKQDLLGATEIWNESDLLSLIKEITTSKTSPIVHLQSFLKMKQESSEACRDFYRRLQIKAACCDFSCDKCKHNNVEKRVKEMFILGLKNKTIQTHILKTESITPGTPLDDILKEAITLEQSILDQATLSDDVGTILHLEETNKRSAQLEANAFAKKSFNPNNRKYQKLCTYCGTKEHQANERSAKCRAFRVKCNFCGIMGHFSKVCRKKSPAQEPHVAALDSTEMSCFFIGEVSSANLPVIAKPLSVGFGTSVSVDAFPDTGANICLLGPTHLQLMKISPDEINQCNHSISVAGGSTMLATGWLRIAVVLGDKCSEQKFYFSDKATRFFLSRQTCIEIGIIPSTFPFPPKVVENEVHALNNDRPLPKRPAVLPFAPSEDNIPKLEAYLLEKFADSTFNADKPFPKLSTPPAHIHLRDDHIIPKPAYWPATVADNWAEDVKKALDRDVELGILKKVPFNEPTTWCARMVVVKKKDGRPRRTVDYQQLNKQCIREPNYSQSPFHTARQIPHNTWRSVLDAVDGYHSVEIDEESSMLTTFITPWGRYRYLRFPQGHCSAGDAFNGRVQEILSDVPRLVRIVDDLCVFDDTIEGHFWHIWDLLEKCAINGIVLNKAKLQFCKKTVDFAGLSITANGVQPSNRTLNAIKNFPPPDDLTKARAFFGLVNQVNWAYANSQEMATFRELVKPNSKYQWTDELKILFEKCKEKIIDQVREGVKRFDTKRITCIQTDFSHDGVGYLLLQKYCNCSLENVRVCCEDGWKLVFAGSRFTKGAEQRYGPTEGELLAVAWSLNHAHIFTKGCSNLIVSTDHKPLLGILNGKPLESIKNPRIVRLKEQTLSFDFVVTHNKGKWHRGPDALSRSPQANVCEMLYVFCENENCLDFDDTENEQKTDVLLAISEMGEDNKVDVDDVANATSDDPDMSKLIELIKNGFPSTQHLTDPVVRPYFNVRHDLWIQNNIVMFKNRIVVPKVLRSRCLKILHSAHQGSDGMKARASNSIYWPGLNEAIRQTRLSCEQCNKIAPSQPREPLKLISQAEYPFQQICMDAFEIAGRHYLALVDRFSGWLIVFHTKGHAQSKHVVDALRSVFTTYGVPEKFFSDGGLPFQGHIVEDFLKTWKVQHVTSSARYPQGNGRAELAVKTAKRLLQQNTAVDGSLNCDKASQAFLQYRNTPLQHLGLSPAQMLFHRELRDGLPTTESRLKPNKLWVIAANQREQAFYKRNSGLIKAYNSHTRNMTRLEIGQEVSVQESDNHKRWLRFGVVVDRDDRKYTIRVHGSGRVITRNRRFLKPVVNRSQDDSIIVSQSTSNANVPQSSNARDDSPRNNSQNPVSNNIATPVDQSPNIQRELHPDYGVEQERDERPVKAPRMLTRLMPHNKPGLKET